MQSQYHLDCTPFWILASSSKLSWALGRIQVFVVAVLRPSGPRVTCCSQLWSPLLEQCALRWLAFSRLAGGSLLQSPETESVEHSLIRSVAHWPLYISCNPVTVLSSILKGRRLQKDLDSRNQKFLEVALRCVCNSKYVLHRNKRDYTLKLK